MFSMTKIGRFLCGFSVVDFSAIGFLDLLKTYKDSTPKITVPVSDLSFTGKAMHFNGLVYKLMVLPMKEEMHFSNVELL